MLWRAYVRGDAAVQVLGVDPRGESVYVSDGWGVAYAALRLRRLSLETGAELASARLGNSARCIAFDQGTLLAATDSKLFRLTADALEEVERWDRRVPRCAELIEGELEAAQVLWARRRDDVDAVRDLVRAAQNPRERAHYDVRDTVTL